jgi:hypothetical protein
MQTPGQNALLADREVDGKYSNFSIDGEPGVEAA